jgi:hypothetical protein
MNKPSDKTIAAYKRLENSLVELSLYLQTFAKSSYKTYGTQENFDKLSQVYNAGIWQKAFVMELKRRISLLLDNRNKNFEQFSFDGVLFFLEKDKIDSGHIKKELENLKNLTLITDYRNQVIAHCDLNSPFIDGNENHKHNIVIERTYFALCYLFYELGKIINGQGKFLYNFYEQGHPNKKFMDKIIATIINGTFSIVDTFTNIRKEFYENE